MKHIIIDAREAFSDRKTGKGQWAYSVIQELLTRENIRLTLLVHVRPNIHTPNHCQIVIAPRGFRFHLFARTFVRRSFDAWYFSPTSFITPLLLPAVVKAVIVVHDVIAWRPEPHQWKARWIERMCLPLLLRRRSVQICTVSQSTTNDLLGLFPGLNTTTVHTVLAGPQSRSAAPAKKDGGYIVCLATLAPRKNQLRLLRAHASLPLEIRSKHPLVLAGGRGWNDEEILSTIQNQSFVEYLGYIDNTKYDDLLDHAHIFAFPSLYEGFGLPVLDAMQRGIPVLTSSAGSLAEVVGNSACIIDPMSVADIARGLLRLCTDTELYTTLSQSGPIQAKQFSWQRTVDALLLAFE